MRHIWSVILIAAPEPERVAEAGAAQLTALGVPGRALHWPDAFPASDGLLLRATGASSPGALRARAEQWRPWRAYAALHLWLTQKRPDPRDLLPA